MCRNKCWMFKCSEYAQSSIRTFCTKHFRCSTSADKWCLLLLLNAFIWNYIRKILSIWRALMVVGRSIVDWKTHRWHIVDTNAATVTFADRISLYAGEWSTQTHEAWSLSTGDCLGLQNASHARQHTDERLLIIIFRIIQCSYAHLRCHWFKFQVANNHVLFNIQKFAEIAEICNAKTCVSAQSRWKLHSIWMLGGCRYAV